MKRSILLLVAGFMVACSQDIELGSDNFVREYGRTGSASIKGIYELEAGGQLLLCGYQTKSRFVSENSVGQVNNQGVTERTNFIALCDNQGRLLREINIPVSDIVYDSRIDLGDLSGKSWLLKIFPREGGYLAMGEFRNFPIDIDLPGDDDLRIEGSGNNLPYLIYLNSNFELERIWHPNQAIPWDFQLHANGVLKEKPNRDGFIFMTGFNTDLQGIIGMQLFELDARGNISQTRNYYPSANPAFARDFSYTPDGNILAIGSQNRNYSLFEFDINSLTLIKRQIFAPETEPDFNNNPFLIETLDNGEYMGFYTDPTQLSYQIDFDQQYNASVPEDMEPTLDDIYPVESLVCANGDVLMYANNLSNSVSEAGILYRLAPDGSLVFRKAYSQSIEDIYETADGSLLVSTEVITRDGITKAYLTKYNADGSL